MSSRRRSRRVRNACCAAVGALLLTSAAAGARTLEFGGYTWQVHRGFGGPGPNLFSDSTDNVFIDPQGQLHLKIRKVGNAWTCSEIYTLDSLGYGTYRFEVGNYPITDPSFVVGLFTYQDDQHEIDVELTRQGDPQAPPGNFTVQPWYIPGNMAKFELGTPTRSTHFYDWRPDAIYFASLDGYYSQPPRPGSVIYDWNYAGDSIPRAGTEKLYINFYLFQGVPPANQLDAELIVRSVTFEPAALAPVPWLAFTVQQGQLVSGDLASLPTIDSNDLELDPGLVGGSYVASAVFEGVSVDASPARLDLTVYASASTAATAAVQLYDFVAARYVTVGSMPLTDTNLWQRFVVPDPAPYLRAADGHVRARLVSRSSVATSRLRVDELRFDGAQ